MKVDMSFIDEFRVYGNVIPMALDKLNKDNRLKTGVAIDLAIKELKLKSPSRRIHDALVTVIGKSMITGRFEGFPDA